MVYLTDFAFYRMYVDKSLCVNCEKCENSCSMQVEILKEINSAECIRCGKCKSVCPTHAIQGSWLKKPKDAE